MGYNPCTISLKEQNTKGLLILKGTSKKGFPPQFFFEQMENTTSEGLPAIPFFDAEL